MKALKIIAATLAVASMALFGIKSVPTDPPPDFKLRQNGLGRWAWVDQDGFQTPFSSSTRIGAVWDAWDWHRYEQKKELRQAWKDE